MIRRNESRLPGPQLDATCTTLSFDNTGAAVSLVPCAAHYPKIRCGSSKASRSLDLSWMLFVGEKSANCFKMREQERCSV
jgi:hypothetical protein